jgi:hypothetical protein
MSSDSYRRQIESVNRDIAQFYNKLADERKKEADTFGKISYVERSISKNTSLSSLQSKAREIERLNRDIEGSKKKQADITRQIADKEKRKHDYEASLMKEQNREREAFERKQKENLSNYKQGISQQLSGSIFSLPFSQENKIIPTGHDVFISHASEDKDSFVRPLAQELQSRGVRVWYDEFALTVGDSLRRSIDRGLADSRFGIVVLSSAFFAKNWPQYELDGLVTKETSSGKKVILPIWHKVSKDEVASYSPTLADKVALNTGIQSLNDIVDELVKVIQPLKENAGPAITSANPGIFSISRQRTHASK